MSDRRRAPRREKWADAVDATPEFNCGTCHLRDRCPDPRKSRRFACTLHMERAADPSQRDFLDFMRDLVTRESVVPDRFAIDDRDAPLAPNAYEWACGERFLNFQPSPFPKQIELALDLFLDKCSYCRGPWYDDIPFDCDIAEIPRRVMLRRFGVCPRCGKTRVDGIEDGREIDYTSLIGIIGQRCVLGSTMILTTEGERSIDSLVTAPVPGWNRIDPPIRAIMADGVAVSVDRLWMGTTDTLCAVSARGSRPLWGKPDHPVRLNDAWVHLEDAWFGMRCRVRLDDGSWVESVVDSTTRFSVEPTTPVFDLHVPGYHAYVANGLEVHNSGKSTSMSIILSYVTHQLLKLKNPSAFYGLKAGTVLFATVVGITYGGAKTSVFDPFTAAVDESPWFRVMHEVLDAAAARLGEEELYRVKDSFLFYRTAGLNISPSSPSRRALRGKTRNFYAQDEISHFGESEKLVNISGLEVWRALSRSMNTVRPAVHRLRRRGRVHVPPALGIGISSPYSISDPGITLFNAARKAVPRTTHTVKLETWRFNPNISFEDLSEEFGLNALSAWRDFGCRVPHSAQPFIENIRLFRPSVDPSLLPCATQATRVVRRASGDVVTVDLTWRRTDTETAHVVALDAGRTKNAFACAVAHMDQNERLVYDLLVEILPTSEAPVSFTMAMHHVLETILRNLRVAAVASDRWQSYYINDRLRDHHQLEVRNITLKYGDFTAWREAVQNGHVDIPRPELPPRALLDATGPEAEWLRDRPTALLLRQGIIVVDNPPKSVEKPTDGNDDVFRAAVLAEAASRDPEVRKMLSPSASRGRTTGAIAAMATVTGGRAIVHNPAPAAPAPLDAPVPVARPQRATGVIIQRGR